MITKIKYTFWFTILFFCLSSCGNDHIINSSEPIIVSSPQIKVLFNTSDGLRDHSEIYVFNGQSPKLDYYHHQILDILRTPGYLKMRMPEGKWNAVIVGCNETNIHPQITQPEFAAAKSEMPMWITKPVGGLLPEVPQIRTALLDELTIEGDRTQNVAAILERNVARVRVVLKDGIGFKTDGVHSFSLKKVPTSLSWDGSLYPNKMNPAISNLPMTKLVRLFASRNEGHQQSDTIDFVIPAHKSLTAMDTTTHHIVLGVKFTTLGSTTFEKDITIATVPKDNKILLINLTAKGGVEVAIDVKDWATVSSTDNPQMYSMSLTSNTSKVATYSMNMVQERNWWVTLDDTDNFEFVNISTTFGQKTASPATIEVRRKTGGQALSTKLNLYIDGLEGLVGKYSITDLIQ